MNEFSRLPFQPFSQGKSPDSFKLVQLRIKTEQHAMAGLDGSRDIGRRHEILDDLSTSMGGKAHLSFLS